MALPSYSTTAASNTAISGINIDEGCAPSGINNAIRQLMADVKAAIGTQGADIASATTTDIGAATGQFVHITGTTTITGLGTVAAGTMRWVEFTGALTLTHNGTSLILPGAANITTVAGDCAEFVSEGSGNWRCLNYLRSGTAPISLGTGVAAFLATPSSANLATAVTDETGSGLLVFATSPTLTTPTLGVASATSINKVALTAPASGATLTIADGKTATHNATTTFAGTDGKTLTINNTTTIGGGDANVLAIAASKTFTVSNSLTLAGTDSTTMTFPGSSATVAGLGINQTFTKGQVGAVVALTDGATVTPDFSLGNNFSWAIGGNRTLAVPTNPASGQSGRIAIRQDTTGSRTLTAAWIYTWAGGAAGALSTPGCSIDGLWFDVEFYGTSTVTMTIAAPGVVTWTGHGMTTGERIQFTTTGALPTGVSASTTYFITVVDANSFKLSTSLANCAAGTFITTSGSQSGTHTAVAGNIILTLNKAFA